MNCVVLIGNLTSDPKLTYTPNTNTAVASFRLAVSRESKDGGADFINCKAFGRQAETLEQYKHKGDEIGVRGHIETGSYKNKRDETVYTTEVICDRIEYTRGSRTGGSEAGEEREVERKPSQSSFADEQFELPDSFSQAEDDIPFK